MRLFALLLICAVSCIAAAASGPDDSDAGVRAFNHAFANATRNMDNAASLALWEDKGTSLLPSTPPIVGKPAIARFLDGVMKQIAGARMQSFDMQCHDINVSGDWATEWCTEHQIVQMPGGKPPFDGRGKMLLVLHRGADGAWRLRTEMWNQA